MKVEIKILERIEVKTAEPNRLGKDDVWITYEVDGARQDIVVLPKETFTEAGLIAVIKAKEAERAKTIGKTYTI